MLLPDSTKTPDFFSKVGTIHYMSPERVVGKPYQYNSDTCSREREEFGRAVATTVYNW